MDEGKRGGREAIRGSLQLPGEGTNTGRAAAAEIRVWSVSRVTTTGRRRGWVSGKSGGWGVKGGVLWGEIFQRMSFLSCNLA